MNTIQTTLYFREGNSDKIYQVAIEQSADGYRVSASWGRRGSTLQTAVKTPGPVLLSAARKVHDRLVAAKQAKGYTPAEEGTPYRSTGNEGRDTGVRCQLLNPVPDDEIEDILSDSRYVLQEKFDGVRLLVRRTGDDVIGINRRGLEVALPQPIHEAALEHPFDFLIDGEAIGDPEAIDSADRGGEQGAQAAGEVIGGVGLGHRAIRERAHGRRLEKDAALARAAVRRRER